jgi:hypothetical protein
MATVVNRQPATFDPTQIMQIALSFKSQQDSLQVERERIALEQERIAADKQSQDRNFGLAQGTLAIQQRAADLAAQKQDLENESTKIAALLGSSPESAAKGVSFLESKGKAAFADVVARANAIAQGMDNIDSGQTANDLARQGLEVQIARARLADINLNNSYMQRAAAVQEKRANVEEFAAQHNALLGTEAARLAEKKFALEKNVTETTLGQQTETFNKQRAQMVLDNATKTISDYHAGVIDDKQADSQIDSIISLGHLPDGTASQLKALTGSMMMMTPENISKNQAKLAVGKTVSLLEAAKVPKDLIPSYAVQSILHGMGITPPEDKQSMLKGLTDFMTAKGKMLPGTQMNDVLAEFVLTQTTLAAQKNNAAGGANAGSAGGTSLVDAATMAAASSAGLKVPPPNQKAKVTIYNGQPVWYWNEGAGADQSKWKLMGNDGTVLNASQPAGAK